MQLTALDMKNIVIQLTIAQAILGFRIESNKTKIVVHKCQKQWVCEKPHKREREIIL